MHQLLYVSATRRDLPEDVLKAILAVSRANNARLNVTGLLLYLDGGFLQILEGARQTLHQLYAVIAKDSRHWEERLLLDQAGTRNFREWSMGFKSLDDSADPRIVGMTQSAIRGLIQPGGAQPVMDILIRTFQNVHGMA